MKSKIISFILLILVFVSCNNTSFDSEQWKNWKESESAPSLRWDMISDLEERHALKGMNKSQIIELLGKPESKNSKEFIYYLGYARKGIDTGSLTIFFQNESVISYKIGSG